MSETTQDTALLAAPRALVVGASSGIGEALARALAAEGFHLALVARRADRLQALAAELPHARAYPHDVTDYDAVPDLFQRILRDLHHLDVVAYVAGVMPPVAPDEYDFTKDRAMVEVNLLGAMAWLGQAAQLFGTLGGGHIVGVSSIAGDRGRVKNPAYHASKAGLTTYLESLRNRLGRKGVHVLTVKPGFVDTAMTQGQDGLFWLIPPEQAARDILKGLKRRKQTIYTPARWRLVALALHHIPSFIFRRLSF